MPLISNNEWQERAEMYKRRCDLMEEEIDILKEKLRIATKMDEFDPTLAMVFGTTGSEAVILAQLLRREHCTKDQLMDAIYSTSIDDTPEPKIIAVFVCKLRQKLNKRGVDILTHWGHGFSMDAENKARVASLVASMKETVGGSYEEALPTLPGDGEIEGIGGLRDV
jgi:two-component system cell cycle response regulator CtrA